LQSISAGADADRHDALCCQVGRSGLSGRRSGDEIVHAAPTALTRPASLSIP
jgi:hypothetical protein